MEIKLSDHFNYKRLFIFVIPSICMMLFTSIYGIVDGYFVSNFAGEIEFSSVNFIYPFLMILGSIGFMFGTGGSALVAKTLGEKNEIKANKIFSMIVYVSIVIAILLAIFGCIFIKDIALLLGADSDMLDNCVIYGRIILLALPFFVLQFEFQSFLIVAEKPRFGLVVTIIAGCANMILDALLIAVLKLGIAGAAIATAASQVVGGIIPLFYFIKKNNSQLRLTKTNLDGRALFKTCLNGSSEFVSNISMALVGMLYNFQLMKYIGKEGVSAYGTFMYIGMIFIAIFIGYSNGIAPIISYNYGCKNTNELKNLFKKSMKIIIAGSFLMLVLSELLAGPLAYLYVGYNTKLYEMTKYVIEIGSISFIFTGLVIFSSSFFTALNDGVVSALISFLRTLVFQVIAIIVLPFIFKEEGIWWSINISEFLSVIVVIIFIIVFKKKYQY